MKNAILMCREDLNNFYGPCSYIIMTTLDIEIVRYSDLILVDFDLSNHSLF